MPQDNLNTIVLQNIHSELIELRKEVSGLVKETSQQNIELRTIKEQTIKTNGRVTSLEEDVDLIEQDRQKLSVQIETSKWWAGGIGAASWALISGLWFIFFGK